MKRLITFFILIPFVAFSQNDASIWDLDFLEQAPKVEETNLKQEAGLKSIFYSSVDYNGKPTKVYAYYGYPKSEKPKDGYPAVVLVHGGGGTAIAKWVRIWNEKGYVALSMDLEGHLPSEHHKDRKGFEGSGPSRYGVFHDNDKPLKEQWYYHAVAQVILANSFVRSLEDVNKDQVGVTGVSWGGMLTSTVAGVDQRFCFAIPIYGCGFLNGTDGAMGQHFKNGNQAYRDNLLNNFEGQKYLPLANMPMLFINGSNDHHFPIPGSVASYKAPKSDSYLYIEDQLGHGHPPAWKVKESYFFADAVINNKPIMSVQKTVMNLGKGTISAIVKSTKPVKATVFYTEDSGKWEERKWKSATANVNGKKVSGEISKNATAAYLFITDENGMTLSSEVKFQDIVN
ncbi:acetylxylan esterase [Flammeovirga aprica]|uniref:Prolyl oligopeptidase family serine peptidase n=1 Tax=Flammeovirga aprica JL-4 TaxID=694437 RepID=A0A7X9RXV1_9BACT|nr:acetylxylan esterase [Flammeovirga aprica]NME70741.1 prolyl oligopeptidase family serine peptidase [Flammeovirga aprica JL-4]